MIMLLRQVESLDSNICEVITLTEWQVFGAIVTIATFLLTIVKPIVALNTTITKLATIVENLDSKISGIITSNDKEHEVFRDKLADHDIRISNIEHDIKGD